MSDRLPRDPPRDAPHPLDNPAFTALTGPHAGFAERRGAAARYLPSISPLSGFAGEPDAAAWADMAALCGPGGATMVVGVTTPPPAGWTTVLQIAGVQMVDESLEAAADPEAIPLGPADVPAMIDLVARTNPGPFEARTLDLGGYLGIFRGGALAAMSGRRMRPPGYLEVSAVCTDPALRGRGLANRLVRAVAAGIRELDAIPFLHVAAANEAAIGLYRKLGLVVRRPMLFTLVRAPG
ncbi:MAG: GNAT family N-acetyltransferase [Nannocystaceae bacterium]